MGLGSVVHSSFKETESLGPPVRKKEKPSGVPEAEECVGVWDFPKYKG